MTGGEVAIPFCRALPTFAEDTERNITCLHAALNSRKDKHMTWTATEHGKSRSVETAGQQFAAKARAANIHGRSAHGLWKSRARAFAEAGGTSAQMGAWTGRENLSEIERYIRNFNRGKCSAAWKQNKKLQLQRVKFQINEKQ